MVISKTRAKRSSSVFSRVTRPSRVTRLACFALSRITLASFLRAKRQLCSQVFFSSGRRREDLGTGCRDWLFTDLRKPAILSRATERENYE